MTLRLLPWILVAALAAGAAAQAPPAAKPETAITGRLAHQGKIPVLKVKDKSYRLTASDDYVNAILQEERVVGREMRLEGRWKNAEAFEVDRLFSVRDGKLYKVVYFCDVCNITSYKPGRCDCCQQPTEVREFLWDPQGIR